MKRYILKRLLSVIPVLFIVSIIIFSLTHLTPGDAASIIFGDDLSPENIAMLREQMGLNDPLVTQYFRWIGNALQGDLGTSVTGEAVAHVIQSHWEPTIILTIYSSLIAVLLAIPFGMLAAKRRGSPEDMTLTVISLCGISMPSFLLGLLLMLLFAVNLKMLPVSGYSSFTDGLGACLRYLTLPAISLGFLHSAGMMRMTRSTMLEVLGSDYIRMAKAKGVHEFSLIAKHAFKNTMVTMSTVIGQSIVATLSGAAITETLFGIPGIGQLMVNSVGRRDYEVIQGIVLVITLINVTVSLLIDLLYGLIDPRIRLS